jgi:hypothetical protein
MSLFQSKYAIVSQYSESTFAAIEVGSVVNPVFFTKMNRNSKLAYLLNKTDSELTLLVVHPDGDSADPAQVHLFLRIGAGDAINFNNISQDIEPGTTFYVYRSGVAAATLGKLQMLTWG